MSPRTAFARWYAPHARDKGLAEWDAAAREGDQRARGSVAAWLAYGGLQIEGFRVGPVRRLLHRRGRPVVDLPEADLALGHALARVLDITRASPLQIAAATAQDFTTTADGRVAWKIAPSRGARRGILVDATISAALRVIAQHGRAEGEPLSGFLLRAGPGSTDPMPASRIAYLARRARAYDTQQAESAIAGGTDAA